MIAGARFRRVRYSYATSRPIFQSVLIFHSMMFVLIHSPFSLVLNITTNDNDNLRNVGTKDSKIRSPYCEGFRIICIRA